jgi:hypothetical protein
MRHVQTSLVSRDQPWQKALQPRDHPQMPATPRNSRYLHPGLAHDAQAHYARSSNNERATPYQIERAQPFGAVLT